MACDIPLTSFPWLGPGFREHPNAHCRKQDSFSHCVFVPRPLLAPWEQFFWFSFCFDSRQCRKESSVVSAISKMSVTEEVQKLQ